MTFSLRMILNASYNCLSCYWITYHITVITSRVTIIIIIVLIIPHYRVTFYYCITLPQFGHILCTCSFPHKMHLSQQCCFFLFIKKKEIQTIPYHWGSTLVNQKFEFEASPSLITWASATNLYRYLIGWFRIGLKNREQSWEQKNIEFQFARFVDQIREVFLQIYEATTKNKK